MRQTSLVTANEAKYAWDHQEYPLNLDRQAGAADASNFVVRVPSTEDQIPPWSTTDYVSTSVAGDRMAVNGGVDWSTQPRQAMFEYVWTMPSSWAKYFSYPGEVLLRLEFYMGLPASYVETDPLFEIDVVNFFVTSWVGKSALTQTNSYLVFKCLVAGVLKYSGVGPVLKARVKAGVSGSVSEYQFTTYLDIDGFYSAPHVVDSEVPARTVSVAPSSLHSPRSSFEDLADEGAGE